MRKRPTRRRSSQSRWQRLDRYYQYAKVVAIAVVVVGAVAYGTAAEAGMLDSEPLADDVPDTSGASDPEAEPRPLSERIEDAESRSIRRINEYRELQGLEPLERSDSLDRVAQGHSDHMARDDFYAHDAPGGPSFESRISRVCASGSENIHQGPLDHNVGVYGGSRNVDTTTASGIAIYLVEGWINSEGHRENIVGPHDQIGLGITVDDGEILATANFC